MHQGTPRFDSQIKAAEEKPELQRREDKYPGLCNHQIMSPLAISALWAMPRFKWPFERTGEELSRMKRPVNRIQVS
ncbi:PREDICTED: putative uncharacterized protein C14orf177 homolog [Myotis davidii]|uniref:putative uncharacterized protein C14orf177 homolog n=1 Tax=Myotis davidii TaxID=225400 RepID=UPI0003EBFAF0|nr:PREDICTED: putative uncharacterized protein C14orf177 homolog [Myotis davidii]